MKESIFTIKRRIGDTLILFNTLSRSLLSTTPRKYNQLLSSIAKEQDEQDDDATTLYEMGFLVDNDVDEFKKYLFQYNSAAEDTRFLTITYLTTTRCNFQCCYCYEGDSLCTVNDSPLIDLETFEVIYRKLLTSSGAKCVDFNFFGGEPLLDFAHLIGGVSVLNKVNAEKGIICSVNIVSNGYLLDQVKIKKCKEIGIHSFQITIDGTKKYHDRYRRLANGKGTYDRIITNVLALIENELEVILNMNYCSENYLGIVEFLETIPPAIKNNVYIKFTELKATALNSYAGGLNDKNILAYNRLYQTLKMLEFPDPDIEMSDYGPCLANRKNSIIISRTGDISKCIYGIGNSSFILGNYFEDPASVEMAFRRHIENVLYLEKCKTCSVLPICKGGCRRIRLERNLSTPPCEFKKISKTMIDTVFQYYHKEDF